MLHQKRDKIIDLLRRAELKKIGRPIGSYDKMIAGHARTQGLVIVTNSIKQFKHASGVRLENRVIR